MSVGFLYASTETGWCEVLNDNRSLALQASNPLYVGCPECECPALSYDPCDVYGVTPSYAPLTWPTTPSDPTNPAPWYDPDYPESNDFLGFITRRIVGHDDASNFDRSTSQRLLDGANATAFRWSGRNITFEVLATGRTECAVMYGVQWLTSLLAGLASRCGSFDIMLRTCCPQLAGTPGSQQWLRSYETGLQTFKGVKLLNGPTWGEKFTFDECEIRLVTFTLHATDPCAYTKCVPCINNAALPTPVNPPSLCNLLINPLCTLFTNTICELNVSNLCSLLINNIPNPACLWWFTPPEEPAVCCEVQAGTLFEGVSGVFTIRNTDPANDWGPVALYIGYGPSGATCPGNMSSVTWARPLVLKRIPAGAVIRVDGKRQAVERITSTGPEPAYDLLSLNTINVECWPVLSTAGCDSVYLGINWGSFAGAWCAGAPGSTYDDHIRFSAVAERFYGCGEGCR